MIKLLKTKTIFSFFFVCFLLFPIWAEAAQIFFDVESREIGVGDQIKVDVLFSSQENINAFEGKVVFSSNLLSLKGIQDGGTIVNFWIEKPKAGENEIIFSGITPGGFKGENGLIFSIFFKGAKEGLAVFTAKEARALLHDGQGTAAEILVDDFQLLIKESAEEILTDPLLDTESPELFVPEIAKDLSIFDGEWFLVFATQDKGSGIDYYAIYETRHKKEATRISEKDWLEAESPYLLRDQELKSYIFVKAVDRSGNERIVVVEPKYPIKWYEIWWIWLIIILLLAIVVFMIIKLVKKKCLRV